jgi:hypothetical protein
MSTSPQTPVSPHLQSEQVVREILTTQWRQEPALVVQSPPGGGKTGIVERLAIQELVLLRGRAMIATLTNAQAYDLARRLTRHYQRYLIYLFVRARLPLPQDLRTIPNLVLANQAAFLPKGPCIIIANAARWSSFDKTCHDHFTCLILDEAYQLSHACFQQLATMADRLVLVGDPGQIAPVVTCDINRWSSDQAGPHTPCPQAVLAQHPSLHVIEFPVSRRLVSDTVHLVQPVFYPTLPFVALSPPGARGIMLPHVGTGMATLDRAIDLAVQGASLVQVELPPLVTGQCDEELAEVIVSLIRALLTRDIRIRDDDGDIGPLHASMIGVVCTHVTQVSAVVKRLPAQSGIFIETADRFQGLERHVMIVYHPLSGLVDLDSFHLNAGRLCVMLSRHRVVCFLVTRQGIEEALKKTLLSGNRVLGIEQDHEYMSWNAHLYVQQLLHRRTVKM